MTIKIVVGGSATIVVHLTVIKVVKPTIRRVTRYFYRGFYRVTVSFLSTVLVDVATVKKNFPRLLICVD